MTLVDALREGIQVTATGLMIVFSVLIILMLVMMLMKLFFYRTTDTKEAKPKKQRTKSSPADEELIAVLSATVAAMSEEELIAVLTAAVAASMNTSTYRLQIKSYRRLPQSTPAWNRAGLREIIDARYSY